MKKKILCLLLTLICSLCLFMFTACNDGDTTTNDNDEQINAYEAEFTVDENVSVYFYSSQDYTTQPIAGTSAYSKDATTGEYLNNGEGQVNFKLVFDDGYELDDVIITGSYSNLKLPDEVGETGVYRITKISGDLTVNVKSKSVTAEEDLTDAYAVNFNLPEHVSIVIYDRQYLAETNTDTDGTSTTATGYARRDSTGKILTDGNGQINFKLICADGYEIKDISINGIYKNLKTPSDTKVADVYRITKIESALIVTVTEAEVSEEEDYTDAYAVTFVGEHCTVYIYKTQDTTGDGEQSFLGYARNSATGKLDNSDGQINFLVVADEGYSVTNVDATPTENRKNVKNMGNGYYRITKISGAITVTITCVADQ